MLSIISVLIYLKKMILHSLLFCSPKKLFVKSCKKEKG
jgi:hypothetical protein